MISKEQQEINNYWDDVAKFFNELGRKTYSILEEEDNKKYFDSQRINSNCKPKEIYTIKVTCDVDQNGINNFRGTVLSNDNQIMIAIDMCLTRLISTLEHEIYSVYNKDEVKILYQIPISLQKYMEVKK